MKNIYDSSNLNKFSFTINSRGDSRLWPYFTGILSAPVEMLSAIIFCSSHTGRTGHKCITKIGL